MQNEREDLSERLLEFGADVVRLTVRLNKTAVGRHISNQLLRSSTSCGANYEEACAAESRADFVHKMQVVLKELRESRYWLKLIKRAKQVSDDGFDPLGKEAEELVKIFAKSVITAKTQRR